MIFNVLYGMRGIERKLILAIHKQMDGLEAAIAALSNRLASLDRKLTDYLDSTKGI